MKKKILFVINSLWSVIVAFTFPVCLGIIYMDITGHSKGYSYDLGPEKDISILLGIIELIVWLLLAISSNVYILKRLSKKNKWLLAIYFVICIVLSAVCIWLLGGWNEYIKVFGVAN